VSLHAARVDRSGRLQRVLELLGDGREHSTLDIAQHAQVCAVNSIIAELRANGYTIACRQDTDPAGGGRVWRYRLSHE
jgi:roadblock/LC7 domain-containing protein